MKKNESGFRKSGLCEQCNSKFRVRGDINERCSKNYKEWMRHNAEVQKNQIGAEVCWHCFRYGQKPSTPDKDARRCWE